MDVAAKFLESNDLKVPWPSVMTGPFGGIRAHRVTNLCLLFASLAYSFCVYWRVFVQTWFELWCFYCSQSW